MRIRVLLGPAFFIEIIELSIDRASDYSGGMGDTFRGTDASIPSRVFCTIASPPPSLGSTNSLVLSKATELMQPLLNTAAAGAWPTLCAATSKEIVGGDYYGPAKRFETAGPAKKVRSNRASHDTRVAHRLWNLSIGMTGVNPGI